MRTAFAALSMWFWAWATAAQEQVWVQVEARPTRAAAEAAAARYAARLDAVNGFAMRSGWYAIALGPFGEETARLELSRLRGAGAIPGDSFVSDGRRYAARFFPSEVATDAGGTANDSEPAGVGTPLAEARRFARSLSADERAEIQKALEWEGVYSGAIDAAFGAGTRAAIRAWQQENGHAATGVLTRAQREELITSYREALAELGVEQVRDAAAGVAVAMPTAQVAFDRRDPPFVIYSARDAGPAQVRLISRPGDAGALAGLYEVMQTLDIVPPEGPRRRRERSFTIEGRNEAIVSTTYAELADGEIKGYTLVWPTGDERRRGRVLEDLRSSFTRLPGALPAPSEPSATTGAELLAGLDVPRPEMVRSGFFVGATSAILTTAELASGCDRLALADETELELVAADGEHGLALLRAREDLGPIASTRFRLSNLPPFTEVAAAGFPHAGRLPAPVLRFGEIAADQEAASGIEPTRLAMDVPASAAGGPVLDSSGAVIGLVLPPLAGPRDLPDGTSLAVSTGAIADFLARNGIHTELAGAGTELSPEDLASRAADISVAVTCWS